MYDCRVRIDFATNGYVMKYNSPEVAKKNKTDKGPWMDPEVSVVFETEDKLVAGLKALLPELKKQNDKANDFDAGLAEALAEPETDASA